MAGVIALVSGINSSPAGNGPVGDEARLEIVARADPALVHECRDRSAAVIDLDLRNPGSRPVRVEAVSVVYFAADRVLRTDRPGESFFGPGAAPRARKIRGRASIEWSGVCLDGIPPGADRVRLELNLSVRARLARSPVMGLAEIRLRPAPSPRALTLPFEGYWLVTQGHGCRTNHRIGGFGGDYAWDFIHFSAAGHTVKDGYETSRRNADSYSFGLPVLAPANGTVIRVVGDIPDNDGLKEYPRRTLLEDLERPQWIFGNFVVLDVGEGAYVLVAHLQQGSITVKSGDRVVAGDPIARCGNSGNTVQPHLHLQVMDAPDPASSGVRGLPAKFLNYREITYTGDEAHKDILARLVAEGDPPEDGIVVPVSSEESKP